MSLNVTKTISKELFIPFNFQILSIWWRDVECWATARFVCWLSDFLIDRIYPNLESISDNERCPASPSFIYEIHYRKSVGEMARSEERERERERDGASQPRASDRTLSHPLSLSNRDMFVWSQTLPGPSVTTITCLITRWEEFIYTRHLVDYI